MTNKNWRDFKFIRARVPKDAIAMRETKFKRSHLAIGKIDEQMPMSPQPDVDSIEKYYLKTKT